MDRVKKIKINFLWTYLLLIWVAEIALVKISFILGALLHIIILLSLFLHGSFRHKTEETKIYIALSFVPLIRIINISIPIVPISTVYWYILVEVPGWLAVLAFIKIFGDRPAELGLKAGRVPLQLTIGIILGIPLGLLCYLTLLPEPLLPQMEILHLIIAIIIVAACALLEETIFRGILFNQALKIGTRFAYIFSSLAYAAVHVFYLSIGYVILVIIAAFSFCKLVKYYNSILAPVAGHLVASVSAYLIWPFYYDVFLNAIKEYDNGAMAKMIYIINPLVENVSQNIISEWPKVTIFVIIFLIILIILRELSSTIAEYSTPPRLCFSQYFIRQINFGLIPLLYVFALNVFVKIVEALIY